MRLLRFAQYEASDRAYLFYCDNAWSVVTDTEHECVTAAIEQANFEFGLLSFRRI